MDGWMDWTDDDSIDNVRIFWSQWLILDLFCCLTIPLLLLLYRTVCLCLRMRVTALSLKIFCALGECATRNEWRWKLMTRWWSERTVPGWHKTHWHFSKQRTIVSFGPRLHCILFIASDTGKVRNLTEFVWILRVEQFFWKILGIIEVKWTV